MNLSLIVFFQSIIFAYFYKYTNQNQRKMAQASPQMFTDLSSNSAYFTIEGNIGCGKTSFLQNLKLRIPQLQFVEEPVKQWQNLGPSKINLLERYYVDPKRWGFTFQTYALFTRHQKLAEACQRFPEKIKISERSILSDKHIFSLLMRELEYTSESEYQIFKSLYSSFQNLAIIKQIKIIYLQCNPQKCYERIKLRGRPEQVDISFQYIKNVHQKHQKWIKSCNSKEVLILDASKDFCSNDELLHQMIQSLVNFIKTALE